MSIHDRVLWLSRRAFLGGTGTLVALPFLDSLAPRRARAAAATAPKRFLAWYWACGIPAITDWKPTGNGVNWQPSMLLTPMMPGTLQLLLVTLDPGGSSGSEHYSHKGEEAGVVIAGTMKLWIEDQAYILKEGDSFRFKSTRRHRFESASKQTTRVLWATTPPIY